MITFDLSCEKSHKFEGWFKNREDFDDQMDTRIIACPLCGSTAITKRLSPVAVHIGRRASKALPDNSKSDNSLTKSPQTKASDAGGGLPAPDSNETNLKECAT